MPEHLSDDEKAMAKKYADPNCPKCKGKGVVVWAMDTGRREYIDRSVCGCAAARAASAEQTPAPTEDAGSVDLYETDHLVYKTSHKGIECEVWWRKETNGYGESKSHYWLKVPKEITKSDEDEWMAYNEHDSLVCPTRPLWGLKVEQDTDFNWANWKHDSYVGGRTNIEITLHGKVVWRMGGFNNLFRSVAVAQAKILEMQEHQFDFADPDSMIGRRVWYYDQPAIIIGHEVPEDRMILKYDGPPQVIPGFGDEPRLGFNMLSAWKLTDTDKLPDSWHGSEVVHDSIFNEHMWWFRDEGQVCPPKKTGQQ